ncbi:hypothetical protein TI39_contig4379g00001 [Zymoseptoria brevis]|uniref:Uncharacterized protein n=1 Tax=Zymoseptoria brevis TaxID=1047168 RepID=A0A0F4G764_9PEZI|nr:hypothetical protein TI39_contig4379g00001 [Zymoseptoria brevis]
MELMFGLAGLPEPDLMDRNQQDSSTLWNRTEIIDTLKAAYGKVYDAIESDLIQIRMLMEDLCVKLGLRKIIEVRAFICAKTTWSDCRLNKASDLSGSWKPHRDATSLKGTWRYRWVYSRLGKDVQNLMLQIDSRQQSIRGTLDNISRQTRRRNVVALPKHLGREHLDSNSITRRNATTLHAVVGNILACKPLHFHNVGIQLHHEATSPWAPRDESNRCFRLGLSPPNSASMRFVEVYVSEDDKKPKMHLIPGMSPTPVSSICTNNGIWFPEILVSDTRGAIPGRN